MLPSLFARADSIGSILKKPCKTEDSGLRGVPRSRIFFCYSQSFFDFEPVTGKTADENNSYLLDQITSMKVRTRSRQKAKTTFNFDVLSKNDGMTSSGIIFAL
jgi:hypothetical protein